MVGTRLGQLQSDQRTETGGDKQMGEAEEAL